MEITAEQPRPRAAAMPSLPAMLLDAIAHQRAGRAGQAAALYRTALTIAPDQPQALYLAGVLELGEGRAAAAVPLLRRAVAARPEHDGAALHLARALIAMQAPEPALAQTMAVLARDPAAVEAWFLLGTALAALARPDAAEAALRQALHLAPDHVSARVNLANALVDQERWDEAEIAYRAALARDPASGEAAASLGCLLTARGRLNEAMAVLRAAIAANPGFAPAHWNLAEAALLAGDFATGFNAYEWRKRHDRFRADFVDLPGPVWDGGDPAGRTILVHAEQGLGDTVQFARYLPAIAARGGRPVLVCDRTLIGLLGGLAGCHVVARDGVLPRYDAWIDQMSLPRAFATTAQTIPAACGYLHADPARIAAWRARLPADPARRRIGLCWAGNPAHSNDARRSLPAGAALVALLAPLRAFPDIDWISLQVGPRAAEAASLGVSAPDPPLVEYADTAALIATLDGVVSVDSSVAHVAGALGSACAVLLPFAPDWRWLASAAETSPWYDSLRLFRQPAPGAWAAAVGTLAAALQNRSWPV
ncbi:MAG: tetratricopeptide repeat protein [Rhodospirillales bacterium]|nr:tetratricopeptide repeat protein [Rhodospirillales bacterium]